MKITVREGTLRTPVIIFGQTRSYDDFRFIVTSGTVELSPETMNFKIIFTDEHGKSHAREFLSEFLPQDVIVARTSDGFVNVFPLKGITGRKRGAYIAPELDERPPVTEKTVSSWFGSISPVLSRLFLLNK